MPLDEQDKQWLETKLEAMETRLLTAFHAWASPIDERLIDKLDGGPIPH